MQFDFHQLIFVASTPHICQWFKTLSNFLSFLYVSSSSVQHSILCLMSCNSFLQKVFAHWASRQWTDMLQTLWSTITNFSLLLTAHLLKTHAPHSSHASSSEKFTIMLFSDHEVSESVRSFHMALFEKGINRGFRKLLKYGLELLVEISKSLTQLYSEDLGSSH